VTKSSSKPKGKAPPKTDTIIRAPTSVADIKLRTERPDIDDTPFTAGGHPKDKPLDESLTRYG
jgi:hypothetical protein